MSKFTRKLTSSVAPVINTPGVWTVNERTQNSTSLVITSIVVCDSGYNELDDTAIGTSAGNILAAGSSNTIIGHDAGSNVTTGDSNICIGRSATTSAAGTSNEIVIGSTTYFAGTPTGITYYATATAGTIALPALSLGFIRILLNGAYVKIPVYGN